MNALYRCMYPTRASVRALGAEWVISDRLRSATVSMLKDVLVFAVETVLTRKAIGVGFQCDMAG